MKTTKEKIISITGSISGTASVLGSWQICHNVCIGLIALLSIFGITIIGMPLEFLTKISIPLWGIAVSLLAITSVIYYVKRCVSQKLLLLNFGLVTIGIPFPSLQKFSLFFWIIGGSLVLISLFLFIKHKFNRGWHNEK